jgi:ATP-dependent RNA helicase RhlE
VCVDEHEFLRDIEKLIKREIPKEIVPGFKPDPHAKAEPILQRQGQGAQGGRGRSLKRNGGAQGELRSKSGGGHGQGREATDRACPRPPPRGGVGGKPQPARPAQPTARAAHAAHATASKAGAPGAVTRTPAAKPAVVHRFGGRSR